MTRSSDLGMPKVLDLSAVKRRLKSSVPAVCRRTIWHGFGALTVIGIKEFAFHVFYRALADKDNRGMLNIAEFHVAMGLIYRSRHFFD